MAPGSTPVAISTSSAPFLLLDPRRTAPAAKAGHTSAQRLSERRGGGRTRHPFMEEERGIPTRGSEQRRERLFVQNRFAVRRLSRRNRGLPESIGSLSPNEQPLPTRHGGDASRRQAATGAGVACPAGQGGAAAAAGVASYP